MGFRLSTIQEYNRFIAIDIGSYKIRVLICEIQNGELVILGRSSVRQERSHTIGGVITDMHGVSESIRRAIDIAWKWLEEIPEDIIVTLLSDSLMSDTITTQYSRADKDSTLTMEEIDAMIKKIESHSFERVRTKMRTEYWTDDREIRLISSTLTSISLDEKRVMNPIGFSGKNVRFTVLNVFAPTSDCNVLRSVITALGRKTISIIPPPLALPKIIEHTEFLLDTNVYLDIGYSHTTIAIEIRGELTMFHTLPFGTELLEIEIGKKLWWKWSLGREHAMIETLKTSFTHFSKTQKCKIYSETITDFFELIRDGLLSITERHAHTLIIKNLFLSGGIFLSPLPKEIISHLMQDTLHRDAYVRLLTHDLEEEQSISAEYATVYWLARIAADLLLIKKDPLIRILRYVLYQYE